MSDVRTLSKVFKALSDETRLQMLGLLFRQGELCVCDFVEVLEITQSKASRHLRYLVNAGLLNDRREAVWVYFRLADNPQPTQAAVLKMLPALVSESLPVDLFDRFDRWNERKTCVGEACKNGFREDTTKTGRTLHSRAKRDRCDSREFCVMVWSRASIDPTDRPSYTGFFDSTATLLTNRWSIRP